MVSPFILSVSVWFFFSICGGLSFLSRSLRLLYLSVQPCHTCRQRCFILSVTVCLSVLSVTIYFICKDIRIKICLLCYYLFCFGLFGYSICQCVCVCVFSICRGLSFMFWSLRLFCQCVCVCVFLSVAVYLFCFGLSGYDICQCSHVTPADNAASLCLSRSACLFLSVMIYFICDNLRVFSCKICLLLLRSIFSVLVSSVILSVSVWGFFLSAAVYLFCFGLSVYYICQCSHVTPADNAASLCLSRSASLFLSVTIYSIGDNLRVFSCKICLLFLRSGFFSVLVSPVIISVSAAMSHLQTTLLHCVCHGLLVCFYLSRFILVVTIYVSFLAKSVYSCYGLSFLFWSLRLFYLSVCGVFFLSAAVYLFCFGLSVYYICQCSHVTPADNTASLCLSRSASLF